MAMVTFLVTAAVLSAFIIIGYRLNMYLYTRGAIGGYGRSGQMEGDDDVSYVRRVQEASLVKVRDYGLSYARTGILVLALVILGVIVSVVFLITTAF